MLCLVLAPFLIAVIIALPVAAQTDADDLVLVGRVTRIVDGVPRAAPCQ